MSRCSVIIPVFNKASLTRQCLDVLLAPPGEKAAFEILVVDDASTDDTPRLLASYGDRVRVVRHETNQGFATAVNDGAAAARGELLVFLNNDTIPQPGWLDALVRYADSHPKVSAVGAKLLFPDGTVQHAGVVICQDGDAGHIYVGFPADHPAVNKSRRFQIVTAACMLVRRSAFEEVGGFDTSYRNSCEDVDFCLRLGQRGHEIHYCHESVLVHFESVSEGRFAHAEPNLELYRKRWVPRVRQDDLHYYVEDGLLSLGYPGTYPLYLNVAPQLAVLHGIEPERQCDRLLRERARQVQELLKQNVLLKVRVQEAEYRAALAAGNGAAPAPKPVPPEPRLLCQGDVHWLASDSTDRLLSLVLPVKDSAAALRALLPKLLGQKSRAQVEFVAIDFGSGDDTVSVLREARATIVEAGSRPLDEDLVRRLAAKYSRGSVLIFLSPRTVPADEQWLASLLAPLDSHPGVSGMQFSAGGSEHSRPVSVFRRTPEVIGQWKERNGDGRDGCPAAHLNGEASLAAGPVETAGGGRS